MKMQCNYNMRLLISIVISMVVSGCASTPPRYASDNNQEGMPVHGNFCGAGVPSLSDEITDNNLKELEAIESFDLLDQACKEHDICYTLNGYFDRACDKELGKNLTRVSDSLSEGSDCMVMVGYMQSYFLVSNFGWVTQSVLYDENKNFINTAIVLPFAMLADLFLVWQIFGVMAVKTPFVVASMSFPDRYEICGKKTI